MYTIIDGDEEKTVSNFVIQKENSKLDRFFTKYGISHSDNYIVHAYKTVDELKQTFPNRQFKINESGERNVKSDNSIIKLYHPIYET